VEAQLLVITHHSSLIMLPLARALVLLISLVSVSATLPLLCKATFSSPPPLVQLGISTGHSDVRFTDQPILDHGISCAALVATIAGPVALKDLATNDMVWSYNEGLADDTLQVVEQVYRFTALPARRLRLEIRRLELNHSHQSIEQEAELVVSAQQRFYEASSMTWLPAHALMANQTLRLRWSAAVLSTPAIILHVGVEPIESDLQQLCSIRVRQQHNYYVASTPASPFVLVHNPEEERKVDWEAGTYQANPATEAKFQMYAELLNQAGRHKNLHVPRILIEDRDRPPNERQELVRNHMPGGKVLEYTGRSRGSKKNGCAMTMLKSDEELMQSSKSNPTYNRNQAMLWGLGEAGKIKAILTEILDALKNTGKRYAIGLQGLLDCHRKEGNISDLSWYKMTNRLDAKLASM
jgi:hypothetical protein